jgi:hypothetical protein
MIGGEAWNLDLKAHPHAKIARQPWMALDLDPDLRVRPPAMIARQPWMAQGLDPALSIREVTNPSSPQTAEADQARVALTRDLQGHLQIAAALMARVAATKTAVKTRATVRLAEMEVDQTIHKKVFLRTRKLAIPYRIVS